MRMLIEKSKLKVANMHKKAQKVGFFLFYREQNIDKIIEMVHNKKHQLVKGKTKKPFCVVNNLVL